jgi:hypothetical protein
MNGCDEIFQKGVPIYGDKVNYVQATLTLFLIGGTTTCIGLNNPMIHLIPVVFFFFFSLGGHIFLRKCNCFCFDVISQY